MNAKRRLEFSEGVIDQAISNVMDGEKAEDSLQKLLEDVTEKRDVQVVFRSPSDLLKTLGELAELGVEDGSHFQVGEGVDIWLKADVYKRPDVKKIVKKTAKEVNESINTMYLGSDGTTGYKNQYGGINNIVHLANAADSGKAAALLDAKNIHYIDNGDGSFGFDYNSARDAAAQMLSANGISIDNLA